MKSVRRVYEVAMDCLYIVRADVVIWIIVLNVMSIVNDVYCYHGEVVVSQNWKKLPFIRQWRFCLVCSVDSHM